jgi:ubiquinone/menaquinone biosynthesis C-methylase UbiE
MQISHELANRHPRLGKFIDFLNGSVLLRGSAANMEILHKKYGDSYLGFAEEMLHITEKLGFNSNQVYERYIVEYVRDLVRFQKQGTYDNGSFEEIRARIYDNEELMGETYLPGLFIAYGFTTLLHEKYKLFERSFLPHIKKEMAGVEIGFGDGFFLWTLLKRVPGIKVSGLDISKSALEFTTKLLSAERYTEREDFSLGLGNIGEPVPIAGASQDWCILTEVIEHVPDRFFTMKEITRFMKPGGRLFLTTVKDCNHMDHIWNPASPEEVGELIVSYGYAIEDSLVYVVKEEFKGVKDDAIGLAYVARKLP